MSADTLTTGRRGEKAAREYLKKNGYAIVAANLRLAGVEIDLIASKEQVLCFVEVKTRQTGNFGPPEEFVDFRKQRRLIRAAKIFCGHRQWQDYSVRFDVISVLNDGRRPLITHLENAFEE